jgi:hypothetical protein
LLGGAVGLTTLPTQVLADTAFTNFSFAATGAPASRTMPDRLSDVINVKDWGAIGNNSNDDTNAIQSAINYAIGPRPNGSVGGRMFFPPGNYKCSRGLVVGSNSVDVGISLIGGGWANTFINNSSISKGGLAYDCLEYIGGIKIGSITATRPGVLIEHCFAWYDLSQCVGGCLQNCHSYGSYNPPNDPNPGGNLNAVNYWLGKACTAIACRTQAGGIGYALCGDGAACVGSSCEMHQLAFRIGWGPQVTMHISQAAGVNTNVLTFSPAPSPLVAVVGRAMSGANIPAGTKIQSTNLGAGQITLTNNLTGNLAQGASVTFDHEIPVRGGTVQSSQMEQNAIGVEIYNGEGCQIVANSIYQQHGYPGNDQMLNLSWSGGTVTATTQDGSPHYIPAGTHIIQFYVGLTNSAYLPSQPENQAFYDGPIIQGAFVAVNSPGPSANYFTYPLAANPGGTATCGWCYPNISAIRLRRAIDCYIGSNWLDSATTHGAVDLNYTGSGAYNDLSGGDPNVYHRNNVFAGCMAGAGWVLPSNTKNLAGCKFINCGGWLGVASYWGGVAGYPATVRAPTGQMHFSDLPDNGATVPQDGPYEGQEFDIVDGATAALGATVSGGGGGGHYKVRWNGSAWTRSA